MDIKPVNPMDIKPVNPSIYPSPNPSGIKITFNIDDIPDTNRRKEKIMIDAIKEVSCTRCLHQEVCRHKPDFLDICNAVSSSVINRPCEDGKKVEMTPITNLDWLGGIQIECRYYQAQAINPRLFDPGIVYQGDKITNPCITATNSSTISNTISTTKKEN